MAKRRVMVDGQVQGHNCHAKKRSSASWYKENIAGSHYIK